MTRKIDANNKALYQSIIEDFKRSIQRGGIWVQEAPMRRWVIKYMPDQDLILLYADKLATDKATLANVAAQERLNTF